MGSRRDLATLCCDVYIAVADISPTTAESSSTNARDSCTGLEIAPVSLHLEVMHGSRSQRLQPACLFEALALLSSSVASSRRTQPAPTKWKIAFGEPLRFDDEWQWG
jgi:hypothetical protein